MIFDLSLKQYRVYTEDEKIKTLLIQIPGIDVLPSCTDATLIIDTKHNIVKGNECEAIPRLSNDYRLMVRKKDEIGAFFWMKGRPTIIFSKPRLQRFGLTVAPELQDYLEEIE